jgi:hypothetical protein
MVLGARPIVAWFSLNVALACCTHAAEEGRVYNGSFTQTAAQGRAPEGWQTAGDKAVVQELTTERDPKRGTVARLRCTQFVAGTSSSHAMIAQVGHVGARNGQWYRLSFWARAADLEAGVAQVQLVNCRSWGSAGLAGSFTPGADWQPCEFVFRATRDVKPADSRLAIHFQSTGTLWLSDVAMEETTEPKRQWLPTITMAGAANVLPNSSFEFGEGWGCSATGYYGWTADVFHRIGGWDESQAVHGKRSWKVTLSAAKPLMLYGGYLRLAEPVRGLELAHAGWVRVTPGQPYVFSIYVKSDRAGTPVHVSLKEPENWRLRNQQMVLIGPQWQRLQTSYAPQGEFVRGSVSFELPKGDNGERTLWIDAAQLERGTSASPYHPRTAIEAGIETGVAGNIFTDPSKGLCFELRAWNDGQVAQPLRGRLRVTDFWGRTAWEEKPNLVVGPGQSAQRRYAVLAGRHGFFRIHWEPEGGLAQSVRCALIEPGDEGDSIFGFNHEFAEDFLQPLAQQAGMRWWRDWSTEWNAVQPKEGAAFDFHAQDVQINRVLEQKGRALVLLPFPSAEWAAAVPPATARWLAGQRAKGLLLPAQQRQVVGACKPARLDDFAQYVRATVKHNQGRITHYEILNESLYTQYSLTSNNNGYQMPDYLDMLRTAYQAAKAADPKCRVVGGIACGPDSRWETQFIEQGGLRWCDVTNYHLYPGRQRVESMEKLFKARWDQMQQRGEAKPIWVTELGLYAEDDPASIPVHFGDSAMENAARPDERTASIDLVQLSTVMFAHGVRKVFFHAATCEGFHKSSSGNMMFEYGGAPRKMYVAVAVMARLLGPDFQFVRKWDQPEWLQAYEFRGRGRTVVIAWTRKADAPKLDVPPGFQAVDFMGDPIAGDQVIPGETPLYLLGK